MAIERKDFLDGRAFPILLIIAALLFLTGRYLLYGVPHEYITGEYKGTFEGDYDFTLELVRSVKDWLSIPLWSDTYSGPIAVFASNFHVFEQALLYPFTGNLALSIKILQALQLLVAGLGMYALSDYLFRNRAAAVFSAVLYMFTPFYIGHLLSYLHYTGVYLLAPLVYLFTLRFIRERDLRFGLAFSLVAVYSLFSHPQNAFIGGIFYGLFFFLVFAREAFDSLREGELRIFLKKMVPYTVVAGLSVALLSVFIVLPTLVDNYPYMRTSWIKGAGELVKVDTGHIGSHSQSLLASITLQHWPWLQTPLKGGVYPGWGYMALYMAPFVMASISLAIEFTWLTFIFLIMAVISVQAALGVNGKPDLFTLASKYIPFFGMSRTPYAYINTAILVFCLLSSVTFARLGKRLSEFFAMVKGAPSSKTVWALLAFIAIPYLIGARYYGNNYNWTFISAKEPDYLGSVWKWMDRNNPDRKRVVETCGIPTAMILGQRMLPNQVDILERYHGKEYLDKLLSLYGFGYVITPALHSQRHRTFDKKGYMVPSVFDKKENMEEYYSALTTEYRYMYDRLKDDPAFNLHTAGTKDVAVFENRSAFSDYEIYAARPVMVLGGVDGFDLLSLDRYKGSRPAALFIAQKENLERLDDISSVSDDIVLHNTDGLDLYVAQNRDKLILFQPKPGASRDWAIALDSFGIQQPFPYHDHSIGNSLKGEMAFAQHPVSTERRGASASADFEVKEGKRYRVMIRTYGAKDAPAVSFNIDGNKKGTVENNRHSGYGWTALWEGELKPGTHRLSITTEKEGPFVIDSVLVTDPYLLGMGAAASLQGFENKSISYIFNHRKFILNGTEAEMGFFSASEGNFSPSIRLGRFEEIKTDADVEVFIDGKKAGAVRYSLLTDDKAREFKLGPIDLTRGRHSINLRGLEKGVYFDLLTLSKETGAINKTEEVRYSRQGPSSYLFEPAGGSPRFVVFNETNYPGWKMDIGGKEYRPVVANMFMNGFLLPEKWAAGKIAYSNRIQKAGIYVSVITFFIIAAGLVVMNFKTRKGQEH